MKYSEIPWIVLFGGRGREQVVARLCSVEIHIRKVFILAERATLLSKEISYFQRLNTSVSLIHRNEISTVLSEFRHCVLLSVGFSALLPEGVFSRHPLALNIHPTLLPKYRGPMSGAHILINGEKESGSTVHILNKEADRGPIVAQSKVTLTPFDTLRSMQRKVYDTEPGVLMEAINKLDSGFQAIPQDESVATYFPDKRKPVDSEINPGTPLMDLVDQLRACDPDRFPPFFYYHGQKVYIRLYREDKPADEHDLL